MPEVVAALKRVNAELTELRDRKEQMDQATAKESAISRTRSALLAKIDLTENPARMQANTLLRRLGISVEIGRYDPQVRYTAKQNGKKMIVVFQHGDKVQAVAYTEDTAIRMWERGETEEPEMNLSLSDVIGKAGKRPEQIKIEPAPSQPSIDYARGGYGYDEASFYEDYPDDDKRVVRKE
jgi:hypothetical protein